VIVGSFIFALIYFATTSCLWNLDSSSVMSP
jgi:hypothetical protein